LAVLLPLLAFLFVISVDYGRVFYYSQVIENCARQGALWASDPSAPAYNLYTGTNALTNAALADAGDLSPAPQVSQSTGTDAAGNKWVAVTVQWQFNTITNFPGVPSVNLSRTVQMRMAP